MENRQKAVRILAALENAKVPISWYSMDEEELIRAITRELNKIDHEQEVQKVS